MQAKDTQLNVNTGRLKRKRDNELSAFMEEVRGMFSKFTLDQKARLESLEHSLSEIKTQNESINIAMSALAAKYQRTFKMNWKVLGKNARSISHTLRF